METYSPALVRPGAAVVFWLLWLAVVSYDVWLIISPERPEFPQDSGYPSRAQDRRSRLLVVIGVIVGTGLAVVAALQLRIAGLGDDWAEYIVGMCLVAGGLAVRIWSVRVLDQVAWARPLVATRTGPVNGAPPGTPVDTAVLDLPRGLHIAGPYRLVRHPAHTGTLLALVGFGIALSNVVALLAAVVLPLPWIAYRIAVEERALLGTLGARYAQYRGRTASLIPGVW
jgi:protein-S-isoprenylcysteine O-methyltransferase Ste14